MLCHELCRIVHTHTVHVFRKRDAHLSVDGIIDIVTVGAQSLHQVHDLQVGLTEQLFLLHQLLNFDAQLFDDRLFVHHLICLFLVLLDVLDAKRLSVANHADGKQQHRE